MKKILICTLVLTLFFSTSCEKQELSNFPDNSSENTNARLSNMINGVESLNIPGLAGDNRCENNILLFPS
jgi:hypothetical protein